MARRVSPVLSQDAEQQEQNRQKMLEGLVPVPGDTFAVREELKAVGAVWDSADKVWKVVPEKLAVARAIVEKQDLAPAGALKAASAQAARAAVDVEDISDPFEDGDADGPRYVVLGKRDGATYEARDTLKAVGARWDQNRRNWVVREDRADYARAVLAEARGGTAPPPAADDFPEAPPAPSEEPAEAPAPRPERPAPPKTQQPPPNTAPTTTPRTPTKMAERIKLGGLWLNKTRDGKEYLSGNLNGNVKILIFKNDYRSADNQPTHVMYLAPVEKQDEQQQRPAAPADGFFSAGGPSAGAGNEENGDYGDDFEDAEPAPPARPRAAAVPARPNGAGNGRPAAPRPAAPPARRGAPAPAGDDGFEDLDDPFAN